MDKVRDIERGDKIGYECQKCGKRYTSKDRIDQDPPRNTKFCPEHYPVYEEVSNAMVAGRWVVRDDEFRELMVELIDEETPYKVWVTGHPNPNRLYVYDPYEVDTDVVDSFGYRDPF